jgi:anti-anti-sigma regulatory factor
VWVRAVDPASAAAVVDVSGVTFLDLAALRQLVTAWDRLVGRGCAPTLRGTPPCVRRLLELTGREQDFGLTASAYPVTDGHLGTGARPQVVKDRE